MSQFARAALALSTDEMEVLLPRSVFAGFDGRLNFRVVAFASVDGGRLSITSDHLPNFPNAVRCGAIKDPRRACSRREAARPQQMD